MDKQQILSKLKPWVNNSRQWQAFSDYLDFVIDQQQKALEQADHSVVIHRSQGAIAAIRKLKYLRDEVDGTANVKTKQ